MIEECEMLKTIIATDNRLIERQQEFIRELIKHQTHMTTAIIVIAVIHFIMEAVF